MNSKVCVVVGSGPGVGLAVARRFAREGFRISLVARRPDALEEQAAELRRAGADVRSFPADAADFESLAGALRASTEQVGPAEVLVYNAAVLRQGMPSTLKPEDILEDFKVNVAGALACANQVIPHMRAQKRGTILFTGGGLALNPFPQYASLAIGKAGIRSLAYSLGGELEADGIQVGTVTICGFVKPGSHFDPDRIAEAYWTLHTQEAGKREREIVYR